jgi:anaerobic magnesium-protoporphyrin IX monomethyl ester cyclase
VADVLVTHSYHLPYDGKQVLKAQPYPPLGTLYAASLLRENGISVSVFDTMLNDPVGGFGEALRRHQPKIVAIYEDDFNFLTKMCLTRMREVAWRMIEQARECGARVIVHGSDATDHAAEYLARGSEFVLIGAAEETLLNVVRAIYRGQDPGEIPGVTSPGSPNSLRFRPMPQSRPGAYSVEMPLPARDLIDVEQYRHAWLSAHGSFSLNMVASRGCPFRCNWCAKPIFGDRYYLRPAEDVAREMQILKREYHADHLWFADDIFALNRHWAQQLATEVERLNCAVPFKVQARADLLTPETARGLGRAGCGEVWMGVESGSQKILDAMDKGLLVEEVISARQNLKQEGIRACYFLQFGYPGESWDDIRKTVDLVRETRPDDIGVSFSYPLPNTKFYDLVHEHLGSKRNWSDSDDLCVMFRGTYTDRFYRSIRDALHAEVDSWKQAKPSEQRNSPMIGQQKHLRELWRQIERAEPFSRNANPTELRQDSLPSDCAPHSASELVSIRVLWPREA